MISADVRGIGAALVARLAQPRSIGIAGIVAAVLGFWLALPPWTVETAGVPIAMGLIAVGCGLAAIPRGEKKLGWWAVGLGVVATVGAIWLQTKSAATLDDVLTAGLVASTLRFATPLAFAAMGGVFSERSGVVNIGLEGMMLVGAFFGIWGSIWSGTWVVGLLMAMLSGAVLALIHAVFSIHLRADQIVSGFAVNFLALGLTGYLFTSIYPGGLPSDISRVPNVHLGFLEKVSFLGDAFSDLNLLVWVMFGTVVLSYVVLFKTPIGLRIRSCGEHPRAAETVGISVYKVRYAAVVTSGVLASLGGAFLSVGFVGTFAENMTSGRGFIALAAVIFGKWRPGWAFAAAILFGFGFALAIPLQREANVSENLISTVPYVLTLVALVGLIGRSVPPAADGKPYVK